MLSIETILGSSDLEKLIGFQGDVDNPAITTFVKDLNGIYLNCNNTMATYFACQGPADIIGRSDYEFHNKSIAKIFRENDKEVILSDTTKIYSEQFKSLSGNDEKMVATSIKMPLKNSQQKIIGVMGFAIIFSQTTLQLKAKEQNNLTTKQLDCLALLAMGKPMKQIAIALSLSQRTVEHYFESIK
jgi:hypothetical protein